VEMFLSINCHRIGWIKIVHKAIEILCRGVGFFTVNNCKIGLALLIVLSFWSGLLGQSFKGIWWVIEIFRETGWANLKNQAIIVGNYIRIR
jgi:hypothetical protein